MKVYESENELGFEISLEDYLRLIKPDSSTAPATLIAVDSEKIEQRWIESAMIGDVRRSLRTRFYVPMHGTAKEKYEYTVKYYHANGKRTELNVNIAKQEYDEINVLYPDVKTITKKRIYLRDDKGDLFTADIKINSITDDTILDGEPVVLEIEFNTPKQKQRWKVPNWLKKILEK